MGQIGLNSQLGENERVIKQLLFYGRVDLSSLGLLVAFVPWKLKIEGQRSWYTAR